MDIRKLTPDQRSSLVTRDVTPFKLAVISEDPNDLQPVKGFLKAGKDCSHYTIV